MTYMYLKYALYLYTHRPYISTTSEFQVISWLCLSFPEYLKIDSLKTHDTLKLDVVAYASYLSI